MGTRIEVLERVPFYESRIPELQASIRKIVAADFANCEKNGLNQTTLDFVNVLWEDERLKTGIGQCLTNLEQRNYSRRVFGEVVARFGRYPSEAEQLREEIIEAVEQLRKARQLV
jgi:hypothetical protein